jgi:uncharacterized protein
VEHKKSLDKPVFSGAMMLSYDDALKLLYRYGGDGSWIRHCLAVSLVAKSVGDVLAPRCALDTDSLTIGALLHDIGRYKTHDPILHGVEGYRLLSGLGHEREAFICASHILCGMARDEAPLYGLPRKDFLPLTLEERLVPLIDGVVEFDKPTTFTKRCESIARRYQGNEQFLRRFVAASATARKFLDDLYNDYGISVENIAAEALGRP